MPLTTLDPTPALVVIDLQKGIVSGSVAHVVPNAAALARAFRGHELPVMLVNVTGRAPGRTDADSRGSRGGTGAEIIDFLDRGLRGPDRAARRPYPRLTGSRIHS
jgi:nicotinamidase-related amidase